MAGVLFPADRAHRHAAAVVGFPAPYIAAACFGAFRPVVRVQDRLHGVVPGAEDPAAVGEKPPHLQIALLHTGVRSLVAGVRAGYPPGIAVPVRMARVGDHVGPGNCVLPPGRTRSGLGPVGSGAPVAQRLEHGDRAVMEQLHVRDDRVDGVDRPGRGSRRGRGRGRCRQSGRSGQSGRGGRGRARRWRRRRGSGGRPPGRRRCGDYRGRRSVAPGSERGERSARQRFGRRIATGRIAAADRGTASVPLQQRHEVRPEHGRCRHRRHRGRREHRRAQGDGARRM